MDYLEAQRRRAVELRDEVFRDIGGGLFLGKERDFVLRNPALNLWGGVRDDAMHYFAANDIAWWKGADAEPTGHLLSSQVACLNHLYPIRQRQDLATRVLQHLDATIEEAERLDTGFVEFEYIGTRRYLKERSFTRGANCTSIDAVMIGRTGVGARKLFLIEWKYTESYKVEDKYVPERARVYDELIAGADGPFIPGVAASGLYFEPFYQMMRQTLLAKLFEANRERDCDECVNVHVIPEGNSALKETITSAALSGVDIHDAWRRILKVPAKYVVTDPALMLGATADLPDTRSWLTYVGRRYW